MSNKDVQGFLQDKSEASMLGKMSLAQYNAELAGEKDIFRSDLKAAEEAEPLLRSTNDMLGKYSAALDVIAQQIDPTSDKAFIDVPGFGKVNKAQVQAISPGLAGFFGGDQVAANKFLQELKVAETLANTALTKGAISNAEMTLFMSPIPSLTDDREKVWKPWLEARIPVIQKMQAYYQQQAMKGQGGGQRGMQGGGQRGMQGNMQGGMQGGGQGMTPKQPPQGGAVTPNAAQFLQ